MNSIEFCEVFEKLTSNPPFPWQQALYDRFVSGAADHIPASCNLPTGLGKTSVIAIWLIALANRPDKMPRRLVYVVNRRTVVDQTTHEVLRIRDSLPKVHVLPDHVRQVAISTLRGQFADNREWSANPSRPAVICGTVDMIGSRLLFSGYGLGFRAKPLHAGFLGQDVLLVHDEAHLEPAFQDLVNAIQAEQVRCGDFGKFRVMELSATSRQGGVPFGLTEADHKQPEVRKRIEAKKTIHLHSSSDEKQLADEIANLAFGFKDSGLAVIVFVRKVEDVEKVVKKLPKERTRQLTGTLRGLERDRLVEDAIFKRFLPKAEPKDETVYLVCTSAGEVGVNISADHMVCDLSTFESMAQRFGRVNRFGLRDDTEIHVVYPVSFGKDGAINELDQRRMKTLALLQLLKGNGSPNALNNLDANARRDSFAPPPIILPTSDILFDAWALTTIRDKLPGRPPVEPYLHGVSEWQPPETYVAWREEVQRINTEDLLTQFEPADLLTDYPLKPHELLRDVSSRVFERLKKLKAEPETPVWIVSEDGTVWVRTLGDLKDGDKNSLDFKTVLLPPTAGGLENGMLTSDGDKANDVADTAERVRVWDKSDPKATDMRLIRRINFEPYESDEQTEPKSWLWFEALSGDNKDAKASKMPVTLTVHVADVVREAHAIIARLPLPDDISKCIKLAAQWHDQGKCRKLFQTILGNSEYPARVLAKSGKKGGRIEEKYRHEFGSLLDTLANPEFAALDFETQDLVLHLIAVHHGRARPHFDSEEAFDPDAMDEAITKVASEIPRRFARLQRKYGRWGLAYLESLFRAADYAASARPSAFEEDAKS